MLLHQNGEQRPKPASCWILYRYNATQCVACEQELYGQFVNAVGLVDLLLVHGFQIGPAKKMGRVSEWLRFRRPLLQQMWCQ